MRSLSRVYDPGLVRNCTCRWQDKNYNSLCSHVLGSHRRPLRWESSSCRLQCAVPRNRSLASHAVLRAIRVGRYIVCLCLNSICGYCICASIWREVSSFSATVWLLTSCSDALFRKFRWSLKDFLASNFYLNFSYPFHVIVMWRRNKA